MGKGVCFEEKEQTDSRNKGAHIKKMASDSRRAGIDRDICQGSIRRKRVCGIRRGMADVTDHPDRERGFRTVH